MILKVESPMPDIVVTILGSGSSGGVPRADGDWGACDPTNPRNRRRRCSLLVEARDPKTPEAPVTRVVVDTSPDFREQMLSAGVRTLDAVLMTHDHADQSHGLDDLRAFVQRRGGVRMPVWMDPDTLGSLTHRFDYIFERRHDYPPICTALPLPPIGEAFTVPGSGPELPVTTFWQQHGPIRSVGYRFGNIAYSSDVSDLDEAAMKAMEGLDLWIVDALRYTPHPTHAHLDKTLGWIADLKPRRAVLTNLHHDLDYTALTALLPEGVEAGYDGWVSERA